MNYYDKQRGALFRPGGFYITKRAVDYCGFEKGALIADIGCGAGETSKLIEREYPVKVVNVEPSSAMSCGGENIISACAESLPFESACFDGALCECVLSVTDDIEAALGELARIIKPGGFVVISDVYSKSEEAAASGALKRLWPKQKLESVLIEFGFEIRLTEDYTRELVKMAAKMIMSGDDCDIDPLELDRKNIGYLLLIAERS